MRRETVHCVCCKQKLDYNGDAGHDGFKLVGVRWWKTRHGYAYSRQCRDIQVAREIAEPLFPVPVRMVPP